MTSSSDPAWPGEWMRGVLALCVLSVLAEGPTHGYAVASRLADAGLGKVKGGTLYPILGRLEAEDYVSSCWVAGNGGPGRKVFEITEAGREHVSTSGAQWMEFTRRAGALLPVDDDEGEGVR